MRIFLFSILCFISLEAYSSNWQQKADFGGTARHRTTSLSIGNKGYMGLGHYNGAGINVLFGDWWEYDPSTNTWTQKADYLGGPCYHATGFTINNLGYVGTGRTSAVGSILVQDFYKYDAVTNIWSQITSFPGSARRGAVSFVLNNNAYVGTGETNSTETNTFYRYTPSTDTWIPIASIPTARTSAIAFSLGLYGYVGTGSTPSGSTNDFWQYNSATNQWIQKADVGTINRQEAVGFGVNDYGYVGTGVDFEGGNNYSDIWEYQPDSDSWTQIEDFEGTARRYLSSFVINNVAYAGLGTNGTNFNDFWKFDQTLSLFERGKLNFDATIFPNPASNYIRLNIPNNFNLNEISVSIIDLNGNVIHNENIEVYHPKIQLQQIDAGQYICQFNYIDRPICTKKLTIIK